MSTTLEILEECFDRIYSTRKSVLISKQKAFAAQERRRRRARVSTPSSSGAANSSSSARRSTPVPRQRTLNHSESNDDEVGHEEVDHDDDVSSLAAKLQQSNTIKPSAPLTVRSTMDLSSNDIAATVVFDEFRTELTSWWVDAAVNDKRDDIDSRTDCADYLTDKYLCQKLDPLAASELVSKVRKTMSKVIEDFASRGHVPADLEEMRFYEVAGRGKGNEVNKGFSSVLGGNWGSSGGRRGGRSSGLVSGMRAGGGGSVVDTGGSGAGISNGTTRSDGGRSSDDTSGGGSNSSNGNAGGSSGDNPKPLTKEEQERARIKEQYLQYMKRGRETKGKAAADEAAGGGVVPSGVTPSVPTVPTVSSATADVLQRGKGIQTGGSNGGGGEAGKGVNAISSVRKASSSGGGSGGDGGGDGGGGGGGGSRSNLFAGGSGGGSRGVGTGADEEAATARDYESLNTDIRSLLSSLQGKSGRGDGKPR